MRQLLREQSVDTRIVGGVPADAGQAPWMVSLANIYTHEHICGGAIIGERTVLTAGHCLMKAMTKDKQIIFYRPDQVFIKYGSLNRHILNPNEDKVSRVTKIILHPKFRYYPDSNITYPIRGDIAIIHLEQPVIESDTVKIIPITKTTPPPGSEATLTGWGLTEGFVEPPTKFELPDLLQMVRLTIITQNQCIRTLGVHELFDRLPRLFICASNPMAVACNSDSGSPLVLDGQVIGIVSHNKEGCPINGTTVFSNPVLVRTWIENNTI